MKLSFLNAVLTLYPRFGQPSVPALSIVDLLMFNSIEAVADLLRDYWL
jgi:hypothetical protein